MVAKITQAEVLLTGLGFTALEAAVYRSLVEMSPATGYRVAQQIGKPISNTYKAIESLASKGAVLIEEGEHRICRAAAPGELLRRLERSFLDRCSAAAEALERLQRIPEDDRVYQVRSRAQTLERARGMIDQATSVVLADLFRGPLEELRGSLQSAAERGVNVACLVYEPVEIPGVCTVQAARATWLASWPGDQMVVVADALQHLVAVVDSSGDGVVQALWSPSTLLSFTQHDGLMSQLIAHRIDTLLLEGAGVEEIRRQREALRRFSVINTPSFAKLTTGGYQEAAVAPPQRAAAWSSRTGSVDDKVDSKNGGRGP